MKFVIMGFAAWAGLLSAQTVINGGRSVKGGWDASAAASTKPAKTGSSLPGSCTSGEIFFHTGAALGQNLYLCKPDNVWTQMTGSSALNSTADLTYYSPFGMGNECNTTYNLPGTAARLWAFTIPFRMYTTRARIYLKGGQSAGMANQLALYDAAGNRVAVSAVINGITYPGPQTYTWGTAVYVGPGTYFLAIGADNVQQAWCYHPTGGDLQSDYGTASVTISSMTFWRMTDVTCTTCGSGSSFTLPATLGGFDSTAQRNDVGLPSVVIE